MAGVKAFLVLSVAALHFAVVAGRVWADELVPDAQPYSSGLKEGGKIPLTVGKAVGELKAIVGLDALHPDTSACIPLEQLFQEISRGVGALLRVGSQEAQASELINSGVLKQTEFRVGNTFAGHHLHVHLNTLAGIVHLLIRLWFIWLFLTGRRKQTQFPHDPEQTLWPAGIATLPQSVPQFHHTQVWIPAAHISDQLQFSLCVLLRMAVRSPGLAGQGCHTPIPAGFPEVDV